MESDISFDKVIGDKATESLFINTNVNNKKLVTIPDIDELKTKVEFLENEVKELKRINKRRPGKWTSR